jgi:hypothetical protein
VMNPGGVDQRHARSMARTCQPGPTRALRI